MTKHSDRKPRARAVRSARIATSSIGVGLSVLVFSSAVQAADPSTVISVDTTRGVITAVERGSGNLYSFSVRNRALLAALKPCVTFDPNIAGVSTGQTFAADLGLATPDGVNAAERHYTLTSAPGSAGRVLGIQPHGKFETVEIMLLEIKRTDGDLATATTLYCNRGTMIADLAADLRERVRTAKLLDLVNKVEHRVQRVGGPAGDGMVSNHGSGLKLQPNQSVRTWMTFTAPAGEQVTLDVPGAAAPFQNVRVTR